MFDKFWADEDSYAIDDPIGEERWVFKLSEALEKVADELGNGYSVTAVALAYVMKRTPYVFPIIGGRKVSHLQDNIRGLEIELSAEQIKFLESVLPFDIGFPMNFIGEDPHRSGETQAGLTKNSANLKWVKHSPSIGGTKI